MISFFSDGAAALVLVSGQKALELGLTVIAKISGYADAAHVRLLLRLLINLEPPRRLFTHL